VTPVTEDRNRLYRKVALRLLPILFVAYVVANLDRNNVGFAKLGFLPDLGFDERVFGLGAGLFYLGYILFEIPSNVLLERIGVRLTFLRIMLLWFLCCIAFAFMGQAWHYYSLRLLLGMAEAGYFPGVLLYLTLWVPRARRARFTALFMCAIPVSGMVGAPVAGAIMQGANGWLGVAGWRWLFVLEAMPAAIMAALVYRYLSNSPAEATWLNDAERSAIVADLAEDRGTTPSQQRGSAFAALANPRLYLVGAMAFALMSGLNGLNLWGPTIIKRSGVGNVLDIGLMISLPQLFGIATQLLNAWHSDRSGERRLHAAIPALLAAIGWFLLPAAEGHATASLVLLGVISGGLFATTAPFWSIPSHYLAGSSAAAGIALVTTIGGLGGFASPAIVGWLTDVTGSLAAGQYFYGAIIIVGVAALFAVTKPSPDASSAG
jgi:sugar phosphate permease